MNHRRKYIAYVIRRLNKMIKEVEHYLLVPSEDNDLKQSLNALLSEVQKLKSQTEDYD